MGEALVQAMRLIKEFAVKEGIESEDLQNETVFSEPPQSLLRDAREHPCASAALLYSGMVNEWFAAAGELPETEESLLTHPPLFLKSRSRLSGTTSISFTRKLSVPLKGVSVERLIPAVPLRLTLAGRRKLP